MTMATATMPTVEAFPFGLADSMKQAAEATMMAICGEKPQPLPGCNLPTPCRGLLGTIHFVGDLEWSLCLVLPHTTAPALAQKFAGFDIPYDSPDMNDVVGEMANILAGDISARLEAKQFKAQLSLPAVARGLDVEQLFPPGKQALRMGFHTPHGPFWLRITSSTSGNGHQE